jgi:orotate phosphoribosyltransferase
MKSVLIIRTGCSLSDDVLEIFRTAGAVKEGHFLLASGLHSPIYWEKFRVLQHPHLTERLCRLITEHFGGQAIDLVAGPTTGGIILAFETARQLGVRGIFAEKEGDVRVFRRDFAVMPGERILVVDDIMTKGGSLRETIGAVDRLGGIVIGVGVLVDRSDGNLNFNLPFFSCLRAPTTVYKSQECPLCATSIPLVKPGSPGQQPV